MESVPTTVGLLDLPGELFGEFLHHCDSSQLSAMYLVSKLSYDMTCKYNTTCSIYVNREDIIVRLLSKRCGSVETLKVPYINGRIWNAIVQHCPAIETLSWNSRVMPLTQSETPLPLPCLRSISIPREPICHWMSALMPGLKQISVADLSGNPPTYLLPLIPQLSDLDLRYSKMTMSPDDHACLVSMLTSATQLTHLGLVDTSTSDYGGHKEKKVERDLVTLDLLKERLPQLTYCSIQMSCPQNEELLQFLNPDRNSIRELFISDIPLESWLAISFPPRCSFRRPTFNSAAEAQMVTTSISSVTHPTLKCRENWPTDCLSKQTNVSSVVLKVMDTAEASHCIRLLTNIYVPPLQDLTLDVKCPFADYMLQEIAKVCPSLISISISCSELDLPRALTGVALAFCTTLSLDISGHAAEQKKSLVPGLSNLIAAFPALTDFYGPYSALTSLEVLSPVAHQLTSVCGNFDLMGEELQSLARFTRLQQLILLHEYGSNERRTDCAPLFAVLETLPDLMCVYLSSHVIRSAPLRRLLQKASKLKRLDFSSASVVTSECIDVLCKHGTQLRSLRLTAHGASLAQQLSVAEALKDHELQSLGVERPSQLFRETPDTMETASLRDEKYGAVVITLSVSYNDPCPAISDSVAYSRAGGSDDSTTPKKKKECLIS